MKNRRRRNSSLVGTTTRDAAEPPGAATRLPTYAWAKFSCFFLFLFLSLHYSICTINQPITNRPLVAGHICVLEERISLPNSFLRNFRREFDLYSPRVGLELPTSLKHNNGFVFRLDNCGSRLLTIIFIRGF